MGQISLTVAGKTHIVQCRDGEEAHLKLLADRLNADADVAIRASGGIANERTLLLLALIVTDKLVEAERNPPTGLPPALVDEIAERLERIASQLEEMPTSP
ncbi:cell division protein ZapA [Sphingomonas sp. CJ99]